MAGGIGVIIAIIFIIRYLRTHGQALYGTNPRTGLKYLGYLMMRVLLRIFP